MMTAKDISMFDQDKMMTAEDISVFDQNIRNDDSPRHNNV